MRTNHLHRLAGDAAKLFFQHVHHLCVQTAESGLLTRNHARAQSKSEVQAFFGLPDSEELLEKFQCTLVQTYACTNNHFTTPRLVRPLTAPIWPGLCCFLVTIHHPRTKFQLHDEQPIHASHCKYRPLLLLSAASAG